MILFWTEQMVRLFSNRELVVHLGPTIFEGLVYSFHTIYTQRGKKKKKEAQIQHWVIYSFHIDSFQRGAHSNLGDQFKSNCHVTHVVPKISLDVTTREDL